jgi:hypothetical protein
MIIKVIKKDFTRLWKFKVPIILAFGLILIGFNSFNFSRAQLITDNQTAYTLGFYLVDINSPTVCTISNGTAKIEANMIEPDRSKRRKVKIEIKFKNGKVSVKDKEDILRTADSKSYGPFYYLDAKIAGRLKVDFKSDDKGNKESTVVDMDFDSLPPIAPDLTPNQIERPSDVPSYFAFTLPCN